MPSIADRVPADAALVMAGLPTTNLSLFRELRFHCGDPTSLVILPADAAAGGARRRLTILRDIEMDRARDGARVDEVHCPADFEPEGGLSGDREIATAQATAECLRRHGVTKAVADRSLPLVYHAFLVRAGIDVACDPDLGVVERRMKDAEEIEHLREAQALTEEAMRMACEMVARAEAAAGGTLHAGGEPLTSERVRSAIVRFCIDRGYDCPGPIVAGAKDGGDCHERGSGPLRTGEPVIIDIFPTNLATHYCGDCTRTVVHGTPSEEVARMHAAVVAAKTAATDAARIGNTGEHVHAETARVLAEHGYETGPLPGGAIPETPRMVHGTGHGIGLEVHEPPLLDKGVGALVEGDALTIEPGLYAKGLGGVRVEDLVVVTKDGPMNLNRLPEGLGWG